MAMLRVLLGCTLLCLVGANIKRQETTNQFCFPEGERETIDPARITIKLDENNWEASILNIRIAAILLREKIGFPAEVREAANIDWTRLGLGESHASLEAWTSTANEENRAELEGQGKVVTNNLGVRGQIGWYIPKYVHDLNPSFNDYTGLLSPEALVLFDGTFWAGAPTWTQYEVHLFNNLGFNKLCLANSTQLGWTVEYHSHDPWLQGIEDTIGNGDPLLFYVWAPHLIFAEFDLVRVQLPPWTEECYADGDLAVNCDYPASDLYKVISTTLETDAPGAFEFLLKFNYTNADQINALTEYFNLGATPDQFDQAACNWILNNEPIWSKWLPTGAIDAVPTSSSSTTTGGSDDNSSVIILAILIPLLFLFLLCIVLIIIAVLLASYYQRRKNSMRLVEPNYKALAFGSILPPEGKRPPSKHLASFERTMLREQYMAFILSGYTEDYSPLEIASALIYIAEASDDALDYQQAVIEKEIRKNPKRAFDSDSISLLMFSAYSRIVALPYVFKMFGRIVHKLDKEVFKKTDGGEDTGKLYNISSSKQLTLTRLEMLMNKIWDKLRVSIPKMPYEILRFCKNLSETIDELNPELKQGRQINVNQTIGKFVFLRLIIPSLVAPHMYGLSQDEVLPASARLLGYAGEVLESLVLGQSLSQTKLSGMANWVKTKHRDLAEFEEALATVGGIEKDNAFEVPKTTKSDSVFMLYELAGENWNGVRGDIESTSSKHFDKKKKLLQAYSKFFDDRLEQDEDDLEMEMMNEMASD